MAANTVTAPMRVGKLRFAIDRGGTFTDVYAEADSLDQPGKIGFSTTLKLLSEDPRHYDSAPREGIRRILEEVTGQKVPRSVPVPHENIESIRMGTTVATNALLERKGARMALLVTKGFKDLLQIGNQSRPRIFDLRVEKPDNLYETVLEVDERLILSSPAGLENGEDGILPQHKDKATGKPFLKEVTGTTGEKLLVEKEPDLASLRVSLQAILDSGIRAVAIVFMHSYAYPNHEISVGTLAKEMGFEQVSLSSEVMPMVKIIPRGFTASADAYLTPHTRAYINSFAKGFENQLKSTPDKHCDTQLSFMQSDGGLTPVEYFSGHRAILSGPAGGVVGYALTTWNAQKVKKAPIVAFDM
jgi:5-oxoprolinase (ATP-hydrolysing)